MNLRMGCKADLAVREKGLNGTWKAIGFDSEGVKAEYVISWVGE